MTYYELIISIGTLIFGADDITWRRKLFLKYISYYGNMIVGIAWISMKILVYSYINKVSRNCVFGGSKMLPYLSQTVPTVKEKSGPML